MGVAEEAASVARDVAEDFSNSSSSAKTTSTSVAILQQLLAISHRYQATRLQLWCEQQLSRCLCASEVCSVLRHAHLYDARQLELCLNWIRYHFAAVVITPGFNSLARDWPEAILKINAFMAGISAVPTKGILEQHHSPRAKRPFSDKEEDSTTKRARNE